MCLTRAKGLLGDVADTSNLTLTSEACDGIRILAERRKLKFKEGAAIRLNHIPKTSLVLENH